MKYIRTKDGRVLKVFCESVSMFEENDGCTYYGKNTVDFETSLFISKSEIIKQSDTIEELCDEFVIIDNLGNKTINDDFKVAKMAYQILNANALPKSMLNGECYGAIWTDKGLIYVAKMNEKGELELL